ncbi:MAG TPA: transcriptional repressor [Kineosporiaceae bacterium]|nr:transcriptional repressor [Kineosporiaceae bacterium]
MAGATPTATRSTGRSTRQKAVIDAALAEADGFVTAQELHERIKSQGDRVGLATVYRFLQTLTDAGEIDQLRLPDGEAAYRRCSRGHHHHLVCRVCGRAVEVEGPAVERWAARVADAHGFTEVRHTVEIQGRCADCSSAAGRAERM